MAMEIATKEIIFYSLTTINLSHWIAFQRLSHNCPRSILSRCITSKIYFTLEEEKKKKKTSRNEGLNGKNGKTSFFVCSFVLQ